MDEYTTAEKNGDTAKMNAMIAKYGNKLKKLRDQQLSMNYIKGMGKNDH
jgi:hypothetical protein